jgi:phospholipid/cholesterol/gamma-HCH transport system ATP-binding protein
MTGENGNAAGGPVLRFEGVTVSFGGVPALEDVSFEAAAGDTLVILGATGSGKTVLLKAALGLVQPSKGSIFLFGRNIAGMEERELSEIRVKVGMLFQEGALFDSLTIEENVGYPLENQKAIRCPPHEVRPRVEEALRFVELAGTLEKMPSELSGGMRRRAAIARALVPKPPLMLYDSPTAGLDPITARTIIALIVKERDLNNTTTLMVTHRYQDGNLMANFRYNRTSGQLESAREQSREGEVKTRFMVLREGRLIFDGPQTDLAVSKDPYIQKFVKHSK